MPKAVQFTLIQITTGITLFYFLLKVTDDGEKVCRLFKQISLRVNSSLDLRKYFKKLLQYLDPKSHTNKK